MENGTGSKTQTNHLPVRQEENNTNIQNGVEDACSHVDLLELSEPELFEDVRNSRIFCAI